MTPSWQMGTQRHSRKQISATTGRRISVHVVLLLSILAGCSDDAECVDAALANVSHVQYCQDFHSPQVCLLLIVNVFLYVCMSVCAIGSLYCKPDAIRQVVLQCAVGVTR